MSNIIKKAEDALTGTHHDSAQSTNHGPHDSNLANKLDPRVDSNRDNRSRHQDLGNTSDPYAINAANRGGSRVDSGVDNRTPHISNVGGYDTRATGIHHKDGATSTMGTGIAGHHPSSAANKLDPRVGSTTGAQHRSQTSTTDDINPGSTTTTGSHSSNIASRQDPRVGFDLSNQNNAGYRRDL